MVLAPASEQNREVATLHSFHDYLIPSDNATIKTRLDTDSVSYTLHTLQISADKKNYSAIYTPKRAWNGHGTPLLCVTSPRDDLSRPLQDNKSPITMTVSLVPFYPLLYSVCFSKHARCRPERASCPFFQWVFHIPIVIAPVVTSNPATSVECRSHRARWTTH